MHEVRGNNAITSSRDLALHVNHSWSHRVDLFTDARWFYSSVCEAWACKGSNPLMGLSLH